MEIEKENIAGTVETLYYPRPGQTALKQWSAGVLIDTIGQRVPFAGPIVVQPGSAVILDGYWVTHPKYGRQFETLSFEYDTNLSEIGLAKYLANNPAIKGIGPVKARAIARKFAVNFEDVLFNRPDEIAVCARVPVETVKTLQDEWHRYKTFNAALTQLASWELTHNQIIKLIDKFGNNCVAIVDQNPFLLIDELPRFGFKRVDQIARRINKSKEMPERVRAGILHVVEEHLDAGDCWVEYDELVNEANVLLAMDCLESREIIQRAIDQLTAQGGLIQVARANRFLYALPHIWKMEREIEQVFRSHTTNHHFIQKPLHVSGEINLNNQQAAAIRMAVAKNMCLISGGAGSGKTFTVAAITNGYLQSGKTVALCAPTGKAAKRIEQLLQRYDIKLRAQTIHRLLGHNGIEFLRGRDLPIDADVVIVDEVSMVDVPLMWHLLQAINFRRTAIIFVGDHNQLPPVGPGNVLRDLFNTGLIPMVELKEIVRQAGDLDRNSRAILMGSVAATSTRSENGNIARPWYLIDQFSQPNDILKFLADLYDRMLCERLQFDLINDVQLITPTHKGPLGTRDLNLLLQRLLQKKLYGVDVPPIGTWQRPKLLQHDKVIQTRNNYDRGVMNGSIGTIQEITAEHYIISFEDKTVEIERDSPDLDDISLAYCLTVHKTQGSEFPCVITIIHKSHAYQHHRNLFYTAVTRASKTAFILGDSWGIRNCASRLQSAQRHTFLSLANQSDQSDIE